jgi:hypothetical protein
MAGNAKRARRSNSSCSDSAARENLQEATSSTAAAAAEAAATAAMACAAATAAMGVGAAAASSAFAPATPVRLSHKRKLSASAADATAAPVSGRSTSSIVTAVSPYPSAAAAAAPFAGEGDAGAGAADSAVAMADLAHCPHSPSAGIFAPALAAASESSPDRHVLLIVKAHDPYYLTIQYGEMNDNRRGLAELLTDNEPLRKWACAPDGPHRYPSKAMEEWVTERQQDSSAAAAAAASSIDLSDLPLPEFKAMTLHMMLRLKQRIESEDAATSDSDSGKTLYVSILPFGELADELAKQIAEDTGSSTPPKRAADCIATDASSKEAWGAFAKAQFQQLHVRESIVRHTLDAKVEEETRKRAAQVRRSTTRKQDCRFFYRLAPDFQSAHSLSHTQRIDVLYLPSLMWFADMAPQAQLLSALRNWLARVNPASTSGAELYPPLEWEALCEQKDLVYKRFAAQMIPCVWRTMPDPARLETKSSSSSNSSSSRPSGLTKFAETLVEDAEAATAHLPPGATSGSFMLKGSWADAKSCVKRVELSASQTGKGASPVQTLCKQLDLLARDWQQRTFTVQPFMPVLPKCEYRIWCIAEDIETAAAAASTASGASAAASLPLLARPFCAVSTRKHWRIVTAIRTSCESAGKVSSVVCGPFSKSTRMCFQFVESLLVSYKEFFDSLLHLGVPALRVDCFFNEQQSRVLLNELTLPHDAMMSSHCHELALMRFIARRIADAIFLRIA